MIAYMCKRFVYTGKGGQGYWTVLGIVYANSERDARTEAVRRWRQVDSVYNLDGID